MVDARALIEHHEERTGRCFTMACRWNKDEGCDKPKEAPCPQEVVLTGNMDAGAGIDMKREWKKRVPV